MSSSEQRRILAAPSDGSGFPNEDPNQNPGTNWTSRPKRTLIESACAACRKRKSKCDGLRPICSRCQNLRTECTYEAEEGESRWSALKRRNNTLRHERDDLEDVMAQLRSRPEDEALEMFHHLRSGGYDDLSNQARQARDAGPTTLAQSTSPTTSTAESQRLPSIETMFEAASASSQEPSRDGMRPPLPRSTDGN